MAVMVGVTERDCGEGEDVGWRVGVMEGGGVGVVEGVDLTTADSVCLAETVLLAAAWAVAVAL